MSVIERVPIKMPPKELDLYLQLKYSYSLWHFSVSYVNFYFIEAENLKSIFRKEISSSKLISYSEYLKKSIQKLEKLKKHNTKILKEILETEFPEIKLWEDKKALETKASISDSKYYEKIFSLTSIDELKERLKSRLGDTKKGSPKNKMNLIATVWSRFIRDDKGACPKDIIGLLR
ncbi:hypothetical protein ACFLRM_06985, partial [Acidobacteriota bacterium]